MPHRWCTYHPVYQQHVRQECYTVHRPVWHHLPGAASLVYLSPRVSAARPPGVLHGTSAGVAVVSGADHLVYLSPGVSAARPRASLCGASSGGSGVPGAGPLHHVWPVYEQHFRDVPETLLSHRDRAVLPDVQDVHLRAGVDGEVRDGRDGLLEGGAGVLPGPVVQKCCRLPGTWHFDPCTCRSHYCPGQVVNCSVQCPGHTSARGLGAAVGMRKVAAAITSSASTFTRFRTPCASRFPTPCARRFLTPPAG